ncbi:MAG: caspase family protein [Cyanophyceae cyanobacterium]
MKFNRRTLLQQASLTLLTLGVSQATGQKAWSAPIQRYLETLAQPSTRKLALLVGVNEYPNSINLSGCVTDVELQKELLTSRFGFNAADILTLTGQQATRKNIEAAFSEHLAQQAAADDIAVFHFSGYGRRVKSAGTSDEARFVNSLVPSDGSPSAQNQLANDLLEDTLLLLARSLPTQRLTIVLDTSYTSSSNPLQGNLRVRSYPHLSSRQLNPEELTFQEQLQSQLKRRPLAGTEPIPGMVLLAAGEDQIATEAEWQGFSAGLFTYALTQSLWQATPASTVFVSLGRAAEQVERLLNKQQPQLKARSKQLFPYYQSPQDWTGAEGTILAVDDPVTAQVSLAGLPARIVENYGLSSCMTLVSSSEEKSASPPQALQLRSREGLNAKARLIKPPADTALQVGQLVQEWIRMLPRNLGLTVALSNNMERIERVDATSAFSSIAAVTSVVTAGEPADCLLGKTALPSQTQAESTEENQAATISYRLLTIGGVPIANTNGASEAVKSAVRRLVPALKTLLAAKLWGLTNNEGSSRLAVRATLSQVDSKQPIVERRTHRSLAPGRSSPALGTGGREPRSPERDPFIPQLAIGSQIQYQLENISDRPLHIMVLGLDSGGNAIALYSPQTRTNGKDGDRLRERVIAPGATITVPNPTDSIDWKIEGPPGTAEIQLIFSQAPFTKTFKALLAQQQLKSDKEQTLDIPNALSVAQALLEDLHVASRVPLDILETAKEDVYALDVNAWASLNFVYQVV